MWKGFCQASNLNLSNIDMVSHQIILEICSFFEDTDNNKLCKLCNNGDVETKNMCQLGVRNLLDSVYDLIWVLYDQMVKISPAFALM